MRDKADEYSIYCVNYQFLYRFGRKLILNKMNNLKESNDVIHIYIYNTVSINITTQCNSYNLLGTK